MCRMVVLGLVASLAAMVLNGCGGDDPVSYPDYLLCAGISQHNGDGWVAIIDCKTDSVVDSLGYPGMLDDSFIAGSPDGQYVAVREANNRPTRIWDLRSKSHVASVANGAPVFAPAISSYFAARLDSVVRYQMPAFLIDTAIGIRLRLPRVFKNGDRMLGVLLSGPTDRPGDMSQLVVLKTDDLSLADSFTIPSQNPAVPLQIAHVTCNEDGSQVYAIGFSNSGHPPVVAGFDLRTRQVRFHTEVWSPTGQCAISPESDELWVTDPGDYPWFGDPVYPGEILILDSKSGQILDTIHTRGLDANPAVRWLVSEIQFVPGSDKAYVNCRPYTTARPILVINTRSRQVEDFILGVRGASAFSIALVPRY